jgi:hypothetical protein
MHQMSAYGPKRTSLAAPRMSAFDDIGQTGLNRQCPISVWAEAQPQGIKPNDHRDSDGNYSDADFRQVRSKPRP